MITKTKVVAVGENNGGSTPGVVGSGDIAQICVSTSSGTTRAVTGLKPGAGNQKTASGVVDVTGEMASGTSVVMCVVRIEKSISDIDANDSISIQILKRCGFSLGNGLIAIEGPDNGATGA